MAHELSKSITKSLLQARQALDDFLAQPAHVGDIQKMAGLLADCFRQGGKVLICGNGGSACDAQHFAAECTGRFRKERAALPVIPLMEAGHMSCVSNDCGFEHVFARGVEAYGKPGDILIAISTSGNSPNVIRASEIAREAGLKVLLFLGKDGGALQGFGMVKSGFAPRPRNGFRKSTSPSSTSSLNRWNGCFSPKITPKSKDRNLSGKIRRDFIFGKAPFRKNCAIREARTRRWCAC